MKSEREIAQASILENKKRLFATIIFSTLVALFITIALRHEGMVIWSLISRLSTLLRQYNVSRLAWRMPAAIWIY